MKRRNSVFNNFQTNKYSSTAKKNRNGILNTQSEFAREFFEEEVVEDYGDVRKKNSIEDDKKNKNNKN